MKFRVAVCGAVLAFGLLSGPNASAAPDCEGASCKPSKPLDIMKFMREQAASTRAAQPHQAKAPAAHVQRPAARKIAKRPKPASLPSEAVQSFAAQPKDNVEVVAGGEVNAIDRAATPAPPFPAPAETTGAAAIDGPIVQVVDAAEFNDIDRKAEAVMPAPLAAASVEQPARQAQAGVSWWQWLWSAIGGTFTALATAMHNLVG